MLPNANFDNSTTNWGMKKKKELSIDETFYAGVMCRKVTFINDFIMDFITDFFSVKFRYKVHNKVGNKNQLHDSSIRKLFMLTSVKLF